MICLAMIWEVIICKVMISEVIICEVIPFWLQFVVTNGWFKKCGSNFGFELCEMISSYEFELRARVTSSSYESVK